MRRSTFILTVLLFITTCMLAQQQSYNFHHVGATQGLADGVVRSIGQDKYGYVWIGTLSGLNRFDGYSVKTFYHNPKDSTSIPSGTIRSIFTDKAGNLWLGCERKLVRYNYATSTFTPIAGTKEFTTFKMVQHSSGEMYLQTTLGLVLFNPSTGRWKALSNQGNRQDTLLGRFNDFFLDGDALYLATRDGIVLFDTKTKSCRKIFAPPGGDKNVELIAKDGKGNLWFSAGNQSSLTKTNLSFSRFQEFTEFSRSPFGVSEGSVYALLVDARGELWATSNINGLAKYNSNESKFSFYYADPLRSSSLAANLTNFIFQGRNGFIWVGTEGNGIDYFHPDNKLFSVIDLPDEAVKRMHSLWARSMVIDKKGNYWFGFAGSLLRMKDKGGDYSIFSNLVNQPKELHTGSVRSLLVDDHNNIWIGTGNGLNCYTAKGEMKFLDEKDSVSKGFYWQLFQDSRKTIWCATARDIFYQDTIQKRFHSLALHPDLHSFHRKGARVIYEDSKKRLWFGLNGTGLMMYDPISRLVKHWQRKNDNDTTIINNIITSIVEDKSGVIWCASFTGLTSYNPNTDRFAWYTAQQGLPSIKLSGLKVDQRNNLWMGSTKGLLMLDASRKNIRTFDVQDGLPTMEFADMDAFETPEGDFIYPTLKGFVSFHPDRYAEKKQNLDVILSDLAISGNKTNFVNAEDLQQLDLKWDQNFFSFSLTAFNYNNPAQTWYAYKLEGFEKEWTYTQNRVVNYTNVPGGDYVLRYKATDDPNNWNVAEKTLAIKIGTVFYKAVWFWAIVALFIVGSLFAYYRNRMRQQKRIYRLQTKAQALEKEKALVMYESLKQQLNPHFLFNSLTSLGSLIKVDQKLASQFLEGMSKIYRYILKSRDHELVSLGEEVKFVENYIRLQKTRFEYGLQVTITIPEDEHHKRIAPVTLQNLVENAIKHNIIDDESPLLIEIFTNDDYLITRNNLQKKKFVDTSNKQGLANLKSLYKYLTRQPITIDEDDKYFTIKIPLI